MLGFLKTTYYLLKNRRVLFKNAVRVINNKSREEYLKKKYGSAPENLLLNNPELLTVGANVVIGDSNRIILSHAPYSAGSKNTLIYLGDNVWTGRNVELNTVSGLQILIKKDSSIQDGCKIIGDVIIEKGCILAPNVYISSGNHTAEEGVPDFIRNQDKKVKNNRDLWNSLNKTVHIEEDCWLGIGVFVKRGIYIGRGSVIGANSVVTKNVPPYSVVVGSNKIAKKRFVFQPGNTIKAQDERDFPYFYRGFESAPTAGTLHFIDDAACLAVLEKREISKLNIRGICNAATDIQADVWLNNHYIGNILIKKGVWDVTMNTSGISAVKTPSGVVPAYLSEHYNIVSVVLNKVPVPGELGISEISQSTI